MLGIPRPGALHKLQCKNRSDQVTGANAPVQALILVVEVLEEGGQGLLLIARAVKVV